MKSQDTQFGFVYGPVEVTRLFSREDSVAIELKTERNTIDVYVTRTGMVRIFQDNREWKQPKRK